MPYHQAHLPPSLPPSLLLLLLLLLQELKEGGEGEDAMPLLVGGRVDDGEREGGVALKFLRERRRGREGGRGGGRVVPAANGLPFFLLQLLVGAGGGGGRGGRRREGITYVFNVSFSLPFASVRASRPTRTNLHPLLLLFFRPFLRPSLPPALPSSLDLASRRRKAFKSL